MNDTELNDEEASIIAAIEQSLPEPPPGLAAEFRARLVREAPVIKHRRRAWPLALAATLALVFAGGWWVEHQRRETMVVRLRAQLDSARNSLSDAHRFDVISGTARAGLQDSAIVAALTEALLNDPSTNVRVAAAEALTLLAEPRTLVEASTRAAALERSPFVIAALISAAERMPATERNQFLKALLENPHLQPGLRAQAESRISS